MPDHLNIQTRFHHAQMEKNINAKKVSSFSVTGSKEDTSDNEISETSSLGEDPFAGMAPDKAKVP